MIGRIQAGTTVAEMDDDGSWRVNKPDLQEWFDREYGGPVPCTDMVDERLYHFHQAARDLQAKVVAFTPPPKQSRPKGAIPPDPEQSSQPALPASQPPAKPQAQPTSQPSQSWARQMLQRVTDSLFRLVGTEEKNSAASAGGNISLTAPDQYRVGDMERAIAETNPNPSDAQLTAGNFHDQLVKLAVAFRLTEEVVVKSDPDIDK